MYFLLFCIPIFHCEFVFVLYSAKVWLMRCCVGNPGAISIRIRVCVDHQSSFFSSIMPSSSGEPSNYTVYNVRKEEGAKFTWWFGQRYKDAPFSFWFELILILILWMYVTYLILCFHCHGTSTFNFSLKFDSVHCVHCAHSVHCVHCVNCLAGVVRSIWSWSTHCHWWQLRSIANPS